jgi:hypothetical protein
MKLRFKPRVVPICILYFLLLFSFNLLFPFYIIQQRSLGLTLDDAAIIGSTALLPLGSQAESRLLSPSSSCRYLGTPGTRLANLLAPLPLVFY